MNVEQRRRRLIKWLEVVRTDVRDLLLDHDIFWEFQGIVAANTQFAKAPGLFHEWIKACFAKSAAVGVRRQAKARDDAVSLRRFLEEVRDHPELVDRDYYIGFSKGDDDWLVRTRHEHFDRVAGVGSAQISPTLVEQQLADLDQAVKNVEHYVDRRVAHHDKRGLAKPTPTFQDLRMALDTLERLVVLYWVLLNGSGPSDLHRPIAPEWKSVLCFAWIPSGLQAEQGGV